MYHPFGIEQQTDSFLNVSRRGYGTLNNVFITQCNYLEALYK